MKKRLGSGNVGATPANSPSLVAQVMNLYGADLTLANSRSLPKSVVNHEDWSIDNSDVCHPLFADSPGPRGKGQDATWLALAKIIEESNETADLLMCRSYSDNSTRAKIRGSARRQARRSSPYRRAVLNNDPDRQSKTSRGMSDRDCEATGSREQECVGGSESRGTTPGIGDLQISMALFRV
eukprot:Selendium_serpulae@DN5488_c0_g1_i2.p1